VLAKVVSNTIAHLAMAPMNGEMNFLSSIFLGEIPEGGSR